MNEKLERAANDLDFGEADSLIPFLCECPRPECREIVMLKLSEYEDVRSSGRGGLAAVGHEDRSIERVVAQNSRSWRRKNLEKPATSTPRRIPEND